MQANNKRCITEEEYAFAQDYLKELNNTLKQ